MRANYRQNWPQADEPKPEGGPWLRIPAPPPVSKTETIWHYTTTAGLIGIVASDRIWATAVSVLNDVTELRYGLELAESTHREFDQGADLHPLQSRFLYEVEYAAKAALQNNAIFVACASRDGDDLGQWRGYAEGGGYAIGLKAIGLCAVVSDDREPATWEHRDLHVGWQRVLYDRAEQTDLLMSLWDFAAAITPAPGSEPGDPEWKLMLHTASSAVTNAVALMKHPGFSGEMEVRHVFDATRHAKRGLLGFRPGPHGVTPFVELGTMPRTPSYLTTTKDHAPLSLETVRVGPNQDQATAEVSLTTLLRTFGHPQAGISATTVPYR